MMKKKEKLFEIENFITIYKNNRKEESYFENINLFSNNKSKSFTPKRIQIFHMIEDDEMKNEKLKRLKKEQEIRQNKLKEQLPNEIKQIEELCDLESTEVIFDSDFDDWSIGSSMFNKIVEGKKQLVFLFETETNKKFGCFINSEIESIDKYVIDPKAFTFSINSNGITKYHVIDSKDIMRIHSSHEEQLMSIGRNDIVIMKKDSKLKSKCNKDGKSYNYQGKEYALTDGEEEFEIKHIQVIQMEETERSKQMKYEKETKQLQELTEQMKTNPIKEMKQLEEWSFSLFDSIIFDSNVCDWNTDTSTFDERILNKKQIVILIETDDGIKFGGYVEKEIDKVNEMIEDENTFLFTFKDNNPKKFDILDKSKGFILNDKSDYQLFSFGNCDILVYKSNINWSTCEKKQQ